MKKNYEKPIESVLDINEQGRTFYFPFGTLFWRIFANSQLKEERILAEKAADNDYFNLIKGGSFTEEFEKVKPILRTKLFNILIFCL